MPPVLHVAFFKLMSGGEHDLLSRNFRMAVDQRHNVLQLIAKTECTAGLVKSRASPDAADRAGHGVDVGLDLAGVGEQVVVRDPDGHQIEIMRLEK